MRHPVLLCLLFLVAGCATLFPANEEPQSLEPVALDAAPDRVYDRALALAFDGGWNITYSSNEERIIELDRVERRFLRETRVQRLDVLIQDAGGGTLPQSRVRLRYHSFALGDPARLSVQEADREEAEAFAEALQKRVAAR